MRKYKIRESVAYLIIGVKVHVDSNEEKYLECIDTLHELIIDNGPLEDFKYVYCLSKDEVEYFKDNNSELFNIHNFEEEKVFNFEEITTIEEKILNNFEAERSWEGIEAEKLAKNLIDIGFIKTSAKTKATNISINGNYFSNEIDILLEDDSLIEVKSSWNLNTAHENFSNTREKLRDNNIKNSLYEISMTKLFIYEIYNTDNLEKFLENLEEVALKNTQIEKYEKDEYFYYEAIKLILGHNFNDLLVDCEEEENKEFLSLNKEIINDITDEIKSDIIYDFLEDNFFCDFDLKRNK